MEFIIDTVQNLDISDNEISELLSQVYVQGGFTTAEAAKIIFDPVSVKKRGMMYTVIENSTKELCGMVILVPPTSDAIVRAKENECEMHLLGVKPKFRRQGIGRKLVAKSIEIAEQNNWLKMILWTQKPMKEAQRLYESFNFLQTDNMTKNGIDFLVYERKLTD